MNTDPFIQYQSRTVLRTVRYPVYKDIDVIHDIINTYHVQREAYNRAIESQLEHPGIVDSKLRSPKTPNGVQGQLTDWRNNDEVHEIYKGGTYIQRPGVLDARDACEKHWKHVAKRMERIFNMDSTQEWIKENPKFNPNNWNKLKFTEKRDWIQNALNNGLEIPPRLCNIFNDRKLFRNRKDGIKSLVSYVPPERIDANTLRVKGMESQLHVKCRKGLPPENRWKSCRVVPRGIHRNMNNLDLLRFEIHITIEVDVVIHPDRSKEILGMDRGITDTLALSNGECWSYPEDKSRNRRLKLSRNRLSHLSSMGCHRRQTRRWNYTLKCKRKVNRSINNCKQRDLYEYTSSLAENHEVVSLEDLKVKT